MTIQTLIAVTVCLVVLIGVPAALIWSVVDHVKHGRRERPDGSASVGNALQELDRLVARPSVEHIVEAESRPLCREDDRAGD